MWRRKRMICTVAISVIVAIPTALNFFLAEEIPTYMFGTNYKDEVNMRINDIYERFYKYEDDHGPYQFCPKVGTKTSNTVPVHSITINASLPRISFGACCGIGHRLSRAIPTIAYALNNSHGAAAIFPDYHWSKFFNDTEYVIEEEYMGPDGIDFNNNIPGIFDDKNCKDSFGTSFDMYGFQGMSGMFDIPLIQHVTTSLHKSLSPLVLSYLQPLRKQYKFNEATSSSGDGITHLCVHFREGNGESGDWQKLKGRHIDFQSFLNFTMSTMIDFVSLSGIRDKITIFVASDNANARPWFQKHVPKEWNVIIPGKEFPKPEAGVWISNHGSNTSDVLSHEQKDEAMADAISDMFALGECDVLFIPSYSSFTFPSIALARARKKLVYFRRNQGYIEYSMLRFMKP